MQPASRNRLGKHTSAQAQSRHNPTVLSYHVTSVLSVVCATQQFSALSVPQLHNMSPLAGKKSPEEFLVEFRGSMVTEQEIARRLHCDLKC
jgi:hypothetical protein